MRCMFLQSQCGRLRVHCSGTDGSNLIVRLEYIASTGQHKEFFFVKHNQHGLQPAKEAIHSPVFCKFDSSTLHVSAVAVQFLFKSFDQCECISCGSRKAGEHFSVVELADLL